MYIREGVAKKATSSFFIQIKSYKKTVVFYYHVRFIKQFSSLKITKK
ncbi:hypothetical protein HNQ94_001143 [Salirhabdus euzebyi]|uniref:Uncharacterized protein n=1 Tax=Salirhabdus euzebyi TaxID=394506 RepID=A0A841PUL4_9BACI|nr:hypothetical protein [Salirhabdus euzebyi]